MGAVDRDPARWCVVPCAILFLGCGGPGPGGKDPSPTAIDTDDTDPPIVDTDDTDDTDDGDTDPPVDTDPASAAIVSVDVADNPRLVLEKRFTVTLDQAGAVHLECVHENQPLEHHVLDSGEPATVHELALRGLLAKQRYLCEITTDSRPDEPWSEEVDVGEIDIPLPTMRVTGTRAGEAGGYTLFNHFRYKTPQADPKVLVVDPEGRVRWYATTEPTGGGLAASYDGEHIVIGGGSGTNADTAFAPTMFGLSREVAYGFPAGPNWHHEAVRHPNGNLVGVHDDPVEDNVVEERDVTTDAVVFRWSSAAAADRGEIPNGGLHLNAVTPVTDVGGEAYYVSLKAKSLIVRVDRDGGKVNWHLGAGGDFPLQHPGGEPAGPSDWFYGQHAPFVVVDAPERVRVFVYDNGDDRPDGTFRSRAVEIGVDLAEKKATLLWDYQEAGWFEPIWGSVVPLSNGNVLIGKGHCWKCVPESSFSAIVEVNPSAGDEVVWRLEFDEKFDALYRATRVDGCEMFANKAYCPAL